MVSIGIKTRRLVHTHKLTTYYTLWRHISEMHYYCTQLCLELLWQTSRSRETQKKSFEEKQIAQEGSNSCPRGHEATALPFALQHLRGVYSRRHQAVCTRYTESARVTKWPTECYVVSKKRSNFLTKHFFLNAFLFLLPK